MLSPNERKGEPDAWQTEPMAVRPVRPAGEAPHVGLEVQRPGLHGWRAIMKWPIPQSAIADNPHFRVLGTVWPPRSRSLPPKIAIWTGDEVELFSVAKLFQASTLRAIAPLDWWCDLLGVPALRGDASMRCGDAIIARAYELRDFNPARVDVAGLRADQEGHR